MKRVFLYSAVAFLLVSCNSGNKETSNKSESIVFSTNIENVDSLANAIPASWKNINTIVEGIAHSGKYSSKIDSVNEFSLLFEQKLGNIGKTMPTEINFTAYACALKPNTKVDVVFSINSQNYYRAFVYDTLFTTLNEWKEIKGTCKLPDNFKSDDVIKAYVWNAKKGECLVDDIKVEVIF